jgi:hypothetical protein
VGCAATRREEGRGKRKEGRGKRKEERGKRKEERGKRKEGCGCAATTSRASAKREEGRLRAFVAANSFAGSEELGSGECRMKR